MQKIFFTADTHFGHENVIQFDKRPFASADEMDEEINSTANYYFDTYKQYYGYTQEQFETLQYWYNKGKMIRKRELFINKDNGIFDVLNKNVTADIVIIELTKKYESSIQISILLLFIRALLRSTVYQALRGGLHKRLFQSLRTCRSTDR